MLNSSINRAETKELRVEHTEGQRAGSQQNCDECMSCQPAS